MDTYQFECSVKRLALILALQSEIEGMKARNKYNEVYGHEPIYNESDFNKMANQLTDLANKHNDQL